MPRAAFLLALGLAALVGAPGARAQVPAPPPAPPSAPEPPKADDATPEPRDRRTLVQELAPGRRVRGRSAFDLASRLLASGQTGRAIALLEDLRAEEPASAPVAAKLREAYTLADRHADALALVDAELADAGPSVPLLAERGAVLDRSGQADEARAAWDAAVALAPDQEMTYRLVANAVGGLRHFGLAAEILERGRERLGVEGLFSLERAHLYTLAGDVARASAVYVEAVAADPQTVRLAQRKLATLVVTPEGEAATSAALADAVRAHPFNVALRELQSAAAVAAGDWEAGFAAVRAADRLARDDAQRDGQAVYAFAQSAADAGELGVAGRALDDLLERHGDGPLAPAATLERARLAEQRAAAAGERPAAGTPSPLTDRARDGYDAFARDHPTHPEAADALARLAELLLHAYRDADGAEAALARLVRVSRDPVAAGRARMELAEVALQRGDLFEARERFAETDETLRTGPLAERARYELALIDFYEGYLYSALARAEAMDDDTAAETANDAVSLRLTLDENAGPDSTNAALRLYGRAALLHRRGRLAEAAATLDSLGADARAHPLADEAMMLRAAVHRDAGRADAALALLERLPTEHPLSFLRDRALFQAAEIYEASARPADALRLYGRLLDDYPGSLLAPRARERLRALRSSS